MGTVAPADSGAVLVTGVWGIGGEFAKQSCEAGFKTFVVDRDAAALKNLPDHALLTKIEADVGTAAGVDTIKAAIPATQPLKYVFLAAATAANQDNKGHAIGELTRANFQDMFQTSVMGKLFLVQAFAENLKLAAAGGKKARVFNVGAPFADGPKPDGKWMAIPGWGGYGCVKVASSYLWDCCRNEMGDVALFGYGHPGLTKTSLTQEVHDKYDQDMMISKMVRGRFEKEDFHLPDEPARLFWSVMEKSSDEDFQGKKWSIDVMTKQNPEVKVKETSDVAAGISIPTK